MVDSIIDDPALRVRLLPGTADRLVVVFSGISHGLGGMPMDEFIGTASADGSAVMFVADIARSWYSASGLSSRIEAAIRAEMRSETVFLGNSMGGYGALLFSARLPASRAVAICPQISMDPAVIDEPRWTEYRAAFGPELVPSLAPLVSGSGVPTCIVHGAEDAPDCRHIGLLSPAPHLRVHAVRGCTHHLAPSFKERGLLAALMADLLSGADPAKTIAHYEAAAVPAAEPFGLADRIRSRLGLRPSARRGAAGR